LDIEAVSSEAALNEGKRHLEKFFKLRDWRERADFVDATEAKLPG
jgi:hypothetical protein